MNQTKGKTKSTSQENLAAVIHQTSSNEARRIARMINAFAHSRSACIQRRQWGPQQIAKIDTALESQPAKQTVQRCRKLPYGELTAALQAVLQLGALPWRPADFLGFLRAAGQRTSLQFSNCTRFVSLRCALRCGGVSAGS